MLNRAFFKRVIPFILTFAVGLLVASFFINIAPTFKFRKHKDSCGKRHEMRMMKQENKRLRWENEQLRNDRIEQSQEMYLSDELVPAPPLPPTPPMAPRINENAVSLEERLHNVEEEYRKVEESMKNDKR